MRKQNLKNKTLKGISCIFKRRYWQTLVFTILMSIPIQAILSHGTVTSPASRVWICFQEDPQSPDSPACISAIASHGTQAFYDWNEVARMDAGGNHMAIIPDGMLASAGRPDKYGGLDQVRDDWVSTPVTPGPFTVTWTINAPHQTAYYDVYITKPDWTPDQPLTWGSLEHLVRTEPRPATTEDNIDVILPQRTGKHVIYSVWQRSLTPEAFYSTSDVDFGNDPLINLPPVAEFTSDNGLCGGPDVDFSAADSYDPNGDDITYSWDFGDGTTAEGVEVSHSYTNLDSATVTLTISDGELSTEAVETIDLVPDPECLEPACPFGTPTEAPLPTVHTSYNNVHVLGTGGPDLDNVSVFTVNWDLSHGLHQFSFNINASPWYIDFSETTQNFNQPYPEITLSGTGISGLDGNYYAAVHEGNFVLAADTYTIYFSNSTTAPECGGNQIQAIHDISLSLSPNPSNTNISIFNNKDLQGGRITIYDLSGKTIKSLFVKQSTTRFDIDISGMKPGLYFVRIYGESGYNHVLNLVVK